MDIEKVLRTMAELLDGESVIFDEDSWSYGSVSLTAYGQKVAVLSARISEDPLTLVVETEDEEGVVETWHIPSFRLDLLDAEEIYWLFHDMWYEIPYDCDIAEWEDRFNKLMED